VIDDMGQEKSKLCILDVRPRTEFGICHLPSSIRTSFSPQKKINLLLNLYLDVPLSEIVANPGSYLPPATQSVYVVCRLGNDSRIAADAIRSALPTKLQEDNEQSGLVVKDLIGGLRAWAKEVDADFPIY
jgi:adenylyltransferase and sulfurtransferase